MRIRLLESLTVLVSGLVMLAPAGAGAVLIPDPGGDPNAAVPLPPPGGRYMGFNDDSLSDLHGLVETDYAELSRIPGGNLIRASFDWRSAEPIDDYWRPGAWSSARDLYDAALSRGMTPLFTIGFAPTWARDSSGASCGEACRLPPARAMNAEWAEFAARVAQQFPRAIIEIWNEPNLSNFWQSGADPQRYAELLNIAHGAIKAASPSTMVLGGALSNNQVTIAGRMAIGEFLRRAYAASPSIAGRMDAVSFHPYPESPLLGADSLFAKTFDDVRQAKAAYGDRATPLFISEVGVAAGSAAAPTEESQADVLLAMYRRTMTMTDVRGIVFHRLIEPADTTGNAFELGSAWLRFGAKPPAPRFVYCRFVLLAGRSYPGCGPRDAQPTSLSLSQPYPGAPEVTARFESPMYGASYECALDDAPFASCSSPATYSSLAEGEHEVAVRTHVPGYTSRTDAGRATVDTQPPDTAIEGAPSGPIARDSATFDLAASEPGVSIECQLDEGPWERCASPAAYWALAEGGHAFRARASDRFGNVDQTPADTLLLVDTEPPTEFAIRKPGKRAKSPRRPRIVWREAKDPTSGVSRYEVSIDGSDAVEVVPPKTRYKPPRPLRRGKHRVVVTAVDAAGNRRDSKPRRFTVRARTR